MHKFVTRRKAAAASAIASVAVGGVVAYAYFTTSGSGTANGVVGTSSALALHGSVAYGGTDTAFYPGGPAATVTFTVDNLSSGNQVLHVIHLSSVTDASDNAITGCTVSDFSMSDVTVDKDYAHGLGQSVTPTGSLSMVDTGVNQDACKSQSLHFHFTSADPGASFAPSPAIPTP
jgi:hypothetical protein